MLVSHYISPDFSALETDATVTDALRQLEESRTAALPVIKGNELVNYASREALEELHIDKLVGELLPYASVLPFVREEDHLLDALRALRGSHMNAIAVLNANNDFQGILGLNDILNELGNSPLFSDSGSIIVLEVGERDYSLADISRIIEYNDAKILGMLITEIPARQAYQVHLRVNVTYLKNILATLDRYDYRVVHYFSSDYFDETTEDRYHSLMKYLDI